MIELKKNIAKSRALNRFIHKLYVDNSIPFKYNNKFQNTSITKMNKLMIKFFHQPEMVISKENNIIPFRFYTTDQMILNGVQYISDPDTNKWIITTHDFGQNKYWSLFYAKPFIELGYNILSFDFRNHGDNKGLDPVTLGILETIDLKSAVEWLVENKHPDWIGLMGVGLGSYTINNLFIEDNQLFKSAQVKFAVCESTYNSVESLIISQRRKWRYIYRDSFVRWTAKRVRKIIAAAEKEELVNFKNNNLLVKLNQKTALGYVPFFYINSSINNLVPAKDSYELTISRGEFFDQKENLDKIVIYDFSQSRLIFKDHFKKNLREIIDFENQVIGDDQNSQKTLERLALTDEDIKNSGEESNELTTFAN